MGVALSDSLFLRGTVVRRVGSRVFGVEPHAPAPAKDAIVVLHQRGERGPRRLVESLHGVRGFGHKAQPNGATAPAFPPELAASLGVWLLSQPDERCWSCS